MALADLIVGAESGGNPIATNSRSSAMGAGQFINSTWLDMIRRNRPDLAQGKSDADILALRANPLLSRQMTDAYARENGQRLTAAGFEATPGNTYLAHFAGPTGALGVLRADPAAPLGPILGDKVMAANPFLARMTAGDLRSWADKKMGMPIPPQAIPMPPAEPQAAPQVAQGPGVAAAPAAPAPTLAAAGPMLDQTPDAMAMASPQGPPALNRPMFRPPPTALAAAALGGQQPQIPPQPYAPDDPMSLWWARQNTMTG
jgi:hypothetical protein